MSFKAIVRELAKEIRDGIGSRIVHRRCRLCWLHSLRFKSSILIPIPLLQSTFNRVHLCLFLGLLLQQLFKRVLTPFWLDLMKMGLMNIQLSIFVQKFWVHFFFFSLHLIPGARLQVLAYIYVFGLLEMCLGSTSCNFSDFWICSSCPSCSRFFFFFFL